ncbi:hypothetical protein [Teredinibacter turnerae]|uniref:hypothetical protein n=1 Tax=Teredinibacter turnerae TaxID=2426 RepID=UPI0030D219CC
MKIYFCFILLFICFSAYAKDSCDLPEGATEGKPIIKVSPMIKGGVNDGDCALVSFTLVEKSGSDGRGLVLKSIKVVFASNKQLAEAVEKAVSKWLYLSNSHQSGENMHYSYVYRSE